MMNAVYAVDADFACIVVHTGLVLGTTVVLAFGFGLVAWGPEPAVYKSGME